MADFIPTTVSGRTKRTPGTGKSPKADSGAAGRPSRFTGDVSPEMRGALTLGGFIGLTAGFLLAPAAAPLIAVAGSAAGATAVGLRHRAGRTDGRTRDDEPPSPRR